MKSISKILSLLLCVSLLSSCATKEQGGAGIGAVAGGLLGAQFGKGPGKVFAAGAGALLGAFTGSAIGKGLDQQDKLMAHAASQRAFEQVPAGQKSQWKNPDTGNSGYITPTKTYQAEGRYCREYTQEITVGNKTEEAYGTACRQPDGSWEIVRSAQ